MREFKDLTNLKVGKLTVLGFSERMKKNRYWKCKCECGEEKMILAGNLIKGVTKSCGNIKCQVRSKHILKCDLTGKQFGKLIVVRYLTNGDWECKCECGNTINAKTHKLTHNITKHCGCIHNLTGKQFGKLIVIGNSTIKNKKRYWKCNCICGKETTVPHADLCNGTTKSCGSGKCRLNYDFTGKKFGKLTVIDYVGYKKWKCKCDCGNETTPDRTALIDGTSTSCGKCKQNTRIGERFNRLTLINYDSPTRRWKCKCDCGNETYVEYGKLQTNEIQSCGCFKQELYDKTNKRFGNLVCIKPLPDLKINSKKPTPWLCKCDCGNEVIRSTNTLMKGVKRNIANCGCLRFGEKSHVWNHNLSAEDRMLSKNRNKLPGLYSWVKNVKKRDKYTCQKCHYTSTLGLHAHHIENFKSNKSIATDINNGITLCKSCHNQFHSMYGNKNNNKQQLDEFLSPNAIIQL